MTAEVINFINKEDICQECHKKTAIKLCDYAIGEFGVSFYRNFSQFKHQKIGLMTCDKNLCKKCTNKFHGMDLCKQHYRKITRR